MAHGCNDSLEGRRLKCVSRRPLCYVAAVTAGASAHTCSCAAAVLVWCVHLQEGEPQGRHVVIVDDLVQSGGTLIECHALLSSLGAKHGEHAQQQRTRLHACICRKVCLIACNTWLLVTANTLHVCQAVCQVC